MKNGDRSRDVLIVGAGIAGAATACLLARQGVGVLLVDKARFPRDKVCGEGLMPPGVDLLRSLGLPKERFGEWGGRAFKGVRFWIPDGQTVDLGFSSLSSDSEGWAFPRLSLDQAVVDHALRQPGVCFLQEFLLESIEADRQDVSLRGVHRGKTLHFQGRLLIGADGIRSKFHRRFGIKKRPVRFKRFALRRRFSEYQGDPRRVEVYCEAHSEAYVAPQQDGGVLVTLLLESTKTESQGRSADFAAWMADFPRLLSQIPSTAQAGEVQATAPLGSRLERSHGERLVLVGDAAGAVDPVTGQGMTMALRDAALSERVVGDALASNRLSSEDLATFTRERDRYFLPAFKMAEDLLLAMHHPKVARRTVRALNRNHRLRDKILSMATDPRGGSRVTMFDKLRLLAGI